jgi:hypothetical protein
MNALDMLWDRAYTAYLSVGKSPAEAREYADERVQEALDDE